MERLNIVFIRVQTKLLNKSSAKFESKLFYGDVLGGCITTASPPPPKQDLDILRRACVQTMKCDDVQTFNADPVETKSEPICTALFNVTPRYFGVCMNQGVEM